MSDFAYSVLGFAIILIMVGMMRVIDKRHDALKRDRAIYEDGAAVEELSDLAAVLRDDEAYPQGQIRAAARDIADDIDDRIATIRKEGRRP